MQFKRVVLPEPGHKAGKRCFAGTGGSHHGHELPSLHREAYALEHLVGGLTHLIGFVQVFDSQHRVLFLSWITGYFE